MCSPTIIAGVAIGASIGAASSAIAGTDPLQGAVLSGVTGGFFPGGVGAVSGPLTSAVTVVPAQVGIASAVGVAGAFAQKEFFSAPDFPTFTSPVTHQQQVVPNSVPTSVTGSGGRQAQASFAEAVRRAQKRKLTQEDVQDLSIDTSSFAAEGLQLV